MSPMPRESIGPVSPNAEHIAAWNDVLVPTFTRFRRVMVDGVGAHSALALRRHPVAPGACVLDVGCGFGETSLELARAVGPSGDVLGIDCCEAFLEVARADARAAGVAQVRFLCGDAQTAPFEPRFDLCFSRFGTMFFESPVAALGNLRRALRPGGRLMMLVWRRTDENEWAALPKRIARTHLPPPPDQAPTCGPGPFSMSDPATVRDILQAAGWSDVELEPQSAQMTVGETVDEAIAFQLSIGPASEIVREAEAEGVAKRPLIERDLAAALRSHATPRGVLLASASWCVTASTPADA
jgi:ubiquinone/menaquinone biosynthesis C-methylase UbiE